MNPVHVDFYSLFLIFARPNLSERSDRLGFAETSGIWSNTRLEEKLHRRQDGCRMNADGPTERKII